MNLQLNKHDLRNMSLTLIIGICLGWLFFSGSADEAGGYKNEFTHQETIWTCAMHPQVRLPEAGKCPICAMDLIPLSTISTEDASIVQDGLIMSKSAIKLADIQTNIIKKRIPEHTLYLSGKVKVDERNIAKLSARFGGRIEKLYINFTGQQVRKSQILATVYSPELLTAQKELIEAIKLKDSNPSFYQSVHRKLELWGISNDQIEQIEQNKEPIVNFNIISPISGTVTKRHITSGEYVTEGSALFEIVDLSFVWILFDAYETDLTWINQNDAMTFVLPALPGKSYKGKITYIDPFINPNTRIAQLRVEVANSGYQLKPGMFANGILKSTPKPERQEILIPKSSILWTGKRAIVYVRDQKKLMPTYLYREIILGSQAGDYYIVHQGLEEGEEIVTNGVFKIDAAAQLAGQASMMNQDSRTTHLIHAGHNPKNNNHLASHTISGNLKSDSFKVFGNCEMCKNRIEEAANSLEGLTKADWNVETKILSVSYNGESVSLEQIHKTIAAVGHDTELETAPDSVYNNLAGCCLYRE